MKASEHQIVCTPQHPVQRNEQHLQKQTDEYCVQAQSYESVAPRAYI